MDMQTLVQVMEKEELWRLGVVEDELRDWDKLIHDMECIANGVCNHGHCDVCDASCDAESAFAWFREGISHMAGKMREQLVDMHEHALYLERNLDKFCEDARALLESGMELGLAADAEDMLASLREISRLNIVEHDLENTVAERTVRDIVRRIHGHDECHRCQNMRAGYFEVRQEFTEDIACIAMHEDKINDLHIRMSWVRKRIVYAQSLAHALQEKFDSYAEMQLRKENELRQDWAERALTEARRMASWRETKM